MPLQDLTPELRTRLSRIEQMVGWFVIMATVILLAGFAYYLYATAQRRGWNVIKINYATALNDAAGIKEGDPVKLMGFEVGEVTQFNLNPAERSYGIRIFFTIRKPYYDYIWSDSRIRVKSDSILGKSYLEVSKGQSGARTVMTNKAGKLLVLNRYLVSEKYKSLTNDLRTDAANTNLSDEAILIEATNQLMKLITNQVDVYYTNAFAAKFNQPANPDSPRESRNYYYLPAIDEPALGDRLNAVANEVERALPNILAMTNQLTAVLSNANNAVSRINMAMEKTDPILTNLTVITGNLRDPNGSLGNWLIPTNLAAQLHETLHSATVALNTAHTTLDDTDTNLTLLATDLDKSLQHLADLTSNLNAQVQMNTNILSEISTAIVHTDGLVQGLKRHWLLRSAFKTKPAKKTNSSPALVAPREKR